MPRHFLSSPTRVVNGEPRVPPGGRERAAEISEPQRHQVRVAVSERALGELKRTIAQDSRLISIAGPIGGNRKSALKGHRGGVFVTQGLFEPLQPVDPGLPGQSKSPTSHSRSPRSLLVDAMSGCSVNVARSASTRASNACPAVVVAGVSISNHTFQLERVSQWQRLALRPAPPSRISRARPSFCLASLKRSICMRVLKPPYLGCRRSLRIRGKITRPDGELTFVEEQSAAELATFRSHIRKSLQCTCVRRFCAEMLRREFHDAFCKRQCRRCGRIDRS